jgi:hypothetical protein
MGVVVAYSRQYFGDLLDGLREVWMVVARVEILLV